VKVKGISEMEFSLYIFDYTFTNYKDTVENIQKAFQDLESSAHLLEDSCVGEKATPCPEKVTEGFSKGSNLDAVGDTDSYPNASNESAIAISDRVTELVDAVAGEEIIVTSDQGDCCVREAAPLEHRPEHTSTKFVEHTIEDSDGVLALLGDDHNEKLSCYAFKSYIEN
jgi:hypothetical protein